MMLLFQLTLNSGVGTSTVCVANHRRALYLMDSTLTSGTPINDAIYRLRLATLSTEIESLRAQLENIRSNRLILAAQLLTDNAAIGTTQTWEQLQKALNALEIQLFIQDSINAGQLLTLDSIGTLCPETHGEAVHRAQILYNRYEEKEFVPVCIEDRAGASSKTEKKQTPVAFQVYPNPSTGWVTIPNPEAVTRAIQVFDIAGKMVFQSSTSSVEFDLSSLGNGVYLLRVEDADTGMTNTLKLVIIK